MKKIIKSSVIILTLLNFVWGEKLAEFEESFKYITFLIDQDKLYVAEKKDCFINIYNRKNFGCLGKFGNKGQGPEDLEYIDFFKIFPDYLYVYSGKKISFFTKSGDFIKTIIPSNPEAWKYIPLDENFVAEKYHPSISDENVIHKKIVLLNSKFQEIKELYYEEIGKLESYNSKERKKELLVINDCFKFDVYRNRLIIGNTVKGFFFSVFNKFGEKLFEIKFPKKKRKIIKEEKKAVLERFRNEIGNTAFERRKNTFNYIFPEYYPEYFDFLLSDEKIYVLLYPRPDKPLEIMMLNWEGEPLGKTALNKIPYFSLIQGHYCVYKNEFYYFYYNLDKNKWELHSERIN